MVIQTNSMEVYETITKEYYNMGIDRSLLSQHGSEQMCWCADVLAKLGANHSIDTRMLESCPRETHKSYVDDMLETFF